MISSELLNQLSRFSQISGKDFQIVKDRLGTLLRSSMIGLAAVASKSLVGDSTAGAEFAKEMMNKTPSNFLDDIQKDTTAQVAAIPEIRKSLTAIAEVIRTNANGNAELPVVVLIDELDRCRPNYAIELLEVVKHFFTTEKFVFVIASDTKQLRESIKTVYGDKFDSEIYLRRFFNRQATLPKPRIIDFISTLYPNLAPTEGYQRIGFKDENDFYRQLAEICEHHDFSLRDIEQVISKYMACKSQIPNCTIYSPTKLLVMLADNHAKNGSNTCATRFVSYNCIDRAINDGSKLNSDIISSPNQSAWSEDKDMIFKWIEDVKSTPSHANSAHLSDEEYKNLIELSGTLTGMEAQ